MTLEELKRRRRELGYTYQKLAEQSGVPLGTVQKIFGGTTGSPRYATLQALEKVLAPEDGFEAEKVVSSEKVLAPENAASSGASRVYTIRDWEALPDDQRMELIDGVLYDMSPPPSFAHQLAVGEIFYQIEHFIRERGGRCMAMTAPLGVQLDRDDRTMVEPDIMILCRREDITSKWYQGAPDFVAEVLSPSTRKKDMGLKLRKYEAAGVREYWMVDTETERIIVHVFGERPDVRIYRFDAPVPVTIYGGALTVDLGRLTGLLAELRAAEEPEDIIG